jgi:hypothetical protein
MEIARDYDRARFSVILMGARDVRKKAKKKQKKTKLRQETALKPGERK